MSATLRPRVVGGSPIPFGDLVFATARVSVAALAVFATLTSAAGQCSGVTIPSSASVASAPSQPGTGLNGEYWDQPANTNAAAHAIIRAGNPDAVFTATHLDYPNGLTDSLGSSSTIGQLLGVDAFPGVHASDPVPGFVFCFHGFLRVDAAGAVSFALSSDDGTCVVIGGVTVVDNPGIHGYSTQAGVACFQAAGLYPLEIIFYNEPEHGGIEWDSSLPGGPNSGAPSGCVGIVPVSHLYDSVPSTLR